MTVRQVHTLPCHAVVQPGLQSGATAIHHQQHLQAHPAVPLRVLPAQLCRNAGAAMRTRGFEPESRGPQDGGTALVHPDINIHDGDDSKVRKCSLKSKWGAKHLLILSLTSIALCSKVIIIVLVHVPYAGRAHTGDDLCLCASRTPAFLAAHRLTAQKCTGPRSAARKARSFMNALKHGQYAPRLVKRRHVRSVGVFRTKLECPLFSLRLVPQSIPLFPFCVTAPPPRAGPVYGVQRLRPSPSCRLNCEYGILTVQSVS